MSPLEGRVSFTASWVLRPPLNLPRDPGIASTSRAMRPSSWMFRDGLSFRLPQSRHSHFKAYAWRTTNVRGRWKLVLKSIRFRATWVRRRTSTLLVAAPPPTPRSPRTHPSPPSPAAPTLPSLSLSLSCLQESCHSAACLRFRSRGRSACPSCRRRPVSPALWLLGPSSGLPCLCHVGVLLMISGNI